MDYDEDTRLDTRFNLATQRLIVVRKHGIIKDFGDNITIWAEGFLQFALIMETLFGNDNPKLLAAINKFITKVFELNTFYT